MKEMFCAHCGRKFSERSIKVVDENVYFHAACLRNRNFDKENYHAMISHNAHSRGSLYRLIPGGK